MTPRQLALDLLLQLEEQEKYANLSLSSHTLDSLSEEDRAFVTALFYTTLEHKITYDYYIAALSGRSIDKISTHKKSILRLGLCQICDMDKIPDFAAVNETVKLAKNPGERSFVNGILRSAVRGKESLPMPPKDKNTARFLSVKYSFPQKTVKRLIGIFGESETEALLVQLSTIAPTDLTVNTAKISRNELVEKFKKDGISAEKSGFSDISVRISGSVAPARLQGFSEGEFFVQDSACAVAVSALNPKAGDTVIDVCSAPGGKSFSASVLMGHTGRIHSFDLHESKLSLIESGAKRLGIDIISVAERDATAPDETLFGVADAVICDVPCSGLGVMGKKPDLKYKDLDAVAVLPSLQLEILEQSVKYLKSGGRVLYSTCTILPEENEGVVDAFLAAHIEFSPVEFEVGSLKSQGGKLTLYPHVHKTDGFFMAVLEKK